MSFNLTVDDISVIYMYVIVTYIQITMYSEVECAGGL